MTEFVAIRNLGNGQWHVPDIEGTMSNVEVLDWMLKTGKAVSFAHADEPCFCVYCMELAEQEERDDPRGKHWCKLYGRDED